MSLFDHLVERALELARPVEPLIEPSPLGPTPIGPSSAGSFDEIALEAPGAGPWAARPTAPTPADAPAWPPAPRAASPAPVSEPPSVARAGDERRLLSGAPRFEPRERAAVSTAAPGVVRERSSIVVERRTTERVERTREVIREREARAVEAAPAPGPTSDRTPFRVPLPPSRDGERAPRPSEPDRAASRERAEPRATRVAPVMPAPRPREPAPSPRPARARRAEPALAPARTALGAGRTVPAESAPTLRIEIGRVVVRAERPAPARREPAARGATTSLAEYLAGRERGDR